MNPETLLYRQIHPSFVEDGKVSSQAFRPTKKDNERLSVYDGEQITAQDSWGHYTTVLKKESVGVLAVTLQECTVQELVVTPDPDAFLEHVLVDFSGKSRKQQKAISRNLRDAAVTRDWVYLPAPP